MQGPGFKPCPPPKKNHVYEFYYSLRLILDDMFDNVFVCVYQGILNFYLVFKNKKTIFMIDLHLDNLFIMILIGNLI